MSTLTATHGPLHLMNPKTASIVSRGYNIVGYVLRSADEGEVCISAESAVRWIPQADYARLMHDQGEAARWLALGRAIERAAGELPDGYEIRVEVEKGAGTVALYDTDCDRIEEFSGDTLAEQLESAIGYAVERAEELGGDELPDGLTRDEDGTLRYKCRHCLSEREWHAEPQDFDRHNHINCGGSPYCLP